MLNIEESTADPELTSDFTAKLWRELREADLEPEFLHVAGPPGTKGSAIAVGSLVLSVVDSRAMSALLACVRGWLRRAPSSVDISMTIDGDSISMPATPAEREALMAEFLARLQEKGKPATVPPPEG